MSVMRSSGCLRTKATIAWRHGAPAGRDARFRTATRIHRRAWSSTPIEPDAPTDVAPTKSPLERIKKELTAFCASEFRSLTPAPPPYLFHYTTAEGMKGIVDSGSIWAHCIEHLNDYTEARYAASVMRAHIDRAYAVEPRPEACELFDALRRRMGGVTASRLFVASFSANGDELGMWRLYANRGTGFSFCFQTTEAASWGGYLVKCQYDPHALTLFCAKSLTKIRELFLADSDNPNPNDYAAEFFSQVAWFAPIYKQEIWSDETEWRLIFIRDPEHHQRRIDGRTYIEIPGSIGSASRIPIAAVCAGPDCDYVDNIRPLQRLMHGKGYGHVQTHLSQFFKAQPGRPAPPSPTSASR